MAGFADAVRKQREKQQTALQESSKNSTQALADALKNKKKSVSFKGLGSKKTSCPPEVAGRTEPKPDVSNPSRTVPQEVPSSSVSISGDQFVHPEQPSSLSEKQVRAFKDAIAFMHSSLPHKEESPQAMRIVLRMIEEEPFLNELMLPEDCGAMVKVLKTSFGVEIAKKQTRSAKTKKSEETQSELMEALDSLGVDFGA